MRSGTLYTPQIVGFAQALKVAMEELPQETQRLQDLRQRLWEGISAVGDVVLNGHPQERLPGNLNVSFGGVDGQALLSKLQPVLAVSSGSACSSAKVEPSYVLRAIGRSPELAYASVRFGLGRFTTVQDIDRAIDHVTATVTALR